MIPIASAQQMRDIDRTAIDEWKIPSLALMETAGASVLKHIQTALPSLEGRHIIIFCGKGNNGGDGLVLARMLLAHKVKLRVLLSHDKSDMSPDAQFNLSLLEKMNFSVEQFEPSIHQNLCADLMVDALLGTGIQGRVKGIFAQMIEVLNRSHGPIFSIDLPSGMDADKAILEGPCVKASHTISIGCPKASMLFSPCKEMVGQLSHEQIGFPYPLFDTLQKHWINQRQSSWSLERPVDSHKGNCGRLLIFAGSKGMAGAGILAVTAAMKSGSAMVQIICPEALLPIYQQACPEAMVLVIPDELDQQGQKHAIQVILERCQKWGDAFVLGPGCGQSQQQQTLIKSLVQQVALPMVIDADGLNALADEAELLKQRECDTIITPHPGEFKTLFKESPATKGMPLIEQCRTFAIENNITLHLKGSTSITAHDNGEVYINGSGNSILSTAGSGDVLSGLTGSLLAQGFNLCDAICAAAYWHGRVADHLKQQGGQVGYTAMDIATHLPKILNA